MADVSVELLHDGGLPLDAANPLHVQDIPAQMLLEAIRGLLVGPVPVDVGGSLEVSNLTVQYESRVSTANATQTPLAAGETFLGAWEDVRDYAAIQVVVLTDQMSAVNGAVAEFSEDPAKGVIKAIPTTILGNSAAHFSLGRQARYFRLRYTNGATAQTVMRSEVAFSFNPPAQVQQPLAAPTTDANLATIVKSHLAGRQTTGAWLPLLVNSSGHLSVRVENPTATQQVAGTVDVGNFPATQPVSGTVTANTGLTQPLTDAQLRAADVPVRDTYLNFAQPVDQAGAGAVLTFTLGATCDLIWVLSRGAVSRAAVGVDPTASRGAYCDDGVPTPLTVRSSSVRVFAPSGATVSVWAYG